MNDPHSEARKIMDTAFPLAALNRAINDSDNLQFNALLVTEVRVLCSERRCRAPWDI